MKLFWKLFCSMVSVTLLACAVGGFVLIDGQFRAALDQEVQALYVENDMLRFVLARELEGRSVSRREELSRLTGSMLLSSGGRTAAFRLSGGDGTVLGGTGLLQDISGGTGRAFQKGRERGASPVYRVHRSHRQI